MFPLLVSRAMVVVKTLVRPLMFPPTIRATPNSAMARLKLAVIAKTTPPNDSFNTAIEASISVAPNVLANPFISGSTDSMALAMKLTIIGVTRMA